MTKIDEGDPFFLGMNLSLISNKEQKVTELKITIFSFIVLRYRSYGAIYDLMW